jgi:6-pyruvoyltetrahydropterin/6-carboxytetrahydropterin synthase
MDMVCDFKTVKLAMSDYLKKFDHAMVVNSDDPVVKSMDPVSERIISLEKTDPTTEVLAKLFYDHLHTQMNSRNVWTDDRGNTYRFPPGLVLERVRVWETSTSWGEYGPTPERPHKFRGD